MVWSLYDTDSSFPDSARRRRNSCLALQPCSQNSRIGRRGGCIFGALCGLGVVCGMFFQWIPAFSCSIGGVACRFDLLSALFLLPVLIVGPLAALHSLGYMKGHDHGKSGIYWFFFNMTQAAMILVTLMTSAVSFLTAWELMGLMSFALVAFEYKSRAAMRAAWIYLLACHAGSRISDRHVHSRKRKQRSSSSGIHSVSSWNRRFRAQSPVFPCSMSGCRRRIPPRRRRFRRSCPLR